MVSDYQARKNEVLALYDTAEKLIADLQAYAQQIGLPDPVERMRNLLADMRGKAERVRADRFTIMIVGEAKCGKSTFINAYLGVELLPVSARQCTCAIIKIKYGEAFEVRATYADGRTERITGDEQAREFLKRNAALNDEYREIPVPTINSEILVKAGLRAREKGEAISVSRQEVEAMLKSPEVQGANLYNLPDYDKRIRAYIEAKKDSWQDIVTEIEVLFPFGKELRGIEILDSPGICARGGVAEITSRYIENADAIFFLKPVIGQSLASTQFSQFLENASVERNKEALFLVFTHIATKTEADLRVLEEEAMKQFSDKIQKRNILFVDSKAELYVKRLSGVEDIEAQLRRLSGEGTLDDFVLNAYFGSFGGDTAGFLEKLQERSRFAQVYDSLERFGRKAHYLLLASLLHSMSALYGKLESDMDARIEMYRQKAESPTELARRIGEVKAELDSLQNKMSRGVMEVVRRFRGEEGIFRREAEAEVADFLSSVRKIDPGGDGAFNKLEILSLQKIRKFEKRQEALQQQVVAEFDGKLVELSDKSAIPFEALQPDFTAKTFEQIRRATRNRAYLEKTEPGGCFKKSHTRSVYEQDRHIELIRNDILRRLEIIKNDFLSQLEDFVENIRAEYMAELMKNARAKEAELDAIMEKKATAEQIEQIVKTLSAMADGIRRAKMEAQALEGGISGYVQRNN